MVVECYITSGSFPILTTLAIIPYLANCWQCLLLIRPLVQQIIKEKLNRSPHLWNQSKIRNWLLTIKPFNTKKLNFLFDRTYRRHIPRGLKSSEVNQTLHNLHTILALVCNLVLRAELRLLLRVISVLTPKLNIRLQKIVEYHKSHYLFAKSEFSPVWW